MFDPVCFHVFGRPIYWYGIMIATAFLAALGHWSILARHERKPSGYAGDLGFWLLIAGIVGARIAYVIANWRQFAAAPITIIRLDQGGLIYYGGFLAAALAAAIFARVRHESFWPFTDFTITALPLGHAFGRIGCFLNGCCYGRPSELPWAVMLCTERVHPVQLYEAFGNFAIYVLLMMIYRRKSGSGIVFALYLTLYPLLRFACEFFRGDPRMPFEFLTMAQAVSLALFAVGGILLHLRISAQARKKT